MPYWLVHLASTSGRLLHQKVSSNAGGQAGSVNKLRAVPSLRESNVKGQPEWSRTQRELQLERGARQSREFSRLHTKLALKPGSNGFTAKAFVTSCETRGSVDKGTHHGEHRGAEESNFAFLAGETG